jgi:hypothetical protein
LEIGRITGGQIMGVRWVGDDSHSLFRQKQLGEDGSVRRGAVTSKVCSRHSSGRYIRTFSRSRRKTS